MNIPIQEPKTEPVNVVFDYRAMRLLIGLLAFALPFLVSNISNETLPSISASYYTNSGDIFVGTLFIVGSFLVAYNGHSGLHAFLSKVAAVATILVATFPTACKDCTFKPAAETLLLLCNKCSLETSNLVHHISAGLFFVILIIFCLWFFPRRILAIVEKRKKYDPKIEYDDISPFFIGLESAEAEAWIDEYESDSSSSETLLTKGPTNKETRRINAYYACGLGMIICIVVMLLWPDPVIFGHTLFFWGESLALIIFGIAWLIASKVFPSLVDEPYRLKPFDWLITSD